MLVYFSEVLPKLSDLVPTEQSGFVHCQLGKGVLGGFVLRTASFCPVSLSLCILLYLTFTEV